MTIKFNRKIKELRHKNNVTQEQLASYLKISSQAVSKWERDEGYPDISLLPRIALYFGITVDELLGIDAERTKAEIEKYIAEGERCLKLGDEEKNFEVWQKAYSEYPREPVVMYYYIHALWYVTDPAEDPKSAEHGIEIGQEILECSVDTKIRNDTIRALAYMNKRLGKLEEAKKYAKMTSNLWTCSDVLLKDVLVGEEKLKHTQELLMKLIDEFGMDAVAISNEFYKVEDQIKICHYILDMFRLLFSGNDYGYYSSRMSRYSLRLAELYSEVRDAVRCVEHLVHAYDHAVMYDNRVDDGKVRTSLLLNRTTVEARLSLRDNKNERDNILNALNEERFDFLRNTPGFIELYERVTDETKANI